MNKFKLTIITPERTFYDGYVDSLVVETANGQLGILANHAPVAIGLEPAQIRIRTGDKTQVAVNDWGFIEFKQNKAVILCQSMEWPHEIELNKVKKTIQEYERKLRESKSKIEYRLNKATLDRAFQLLRVAKK